MMTIKNLKLLTFLTLTVLTGGFAFGQTVIISDNFNANNAGSGFGLGTGINGGINPPTTRLTGTAAEDLRYIATDTTKAATAYTISGNKASISSAGSPGRFVLSANGSSPFDFGTQLGIAAATASDPAIYDIAISMKVNSAATQRASFALGTTEGNNATWDFGVQVYRAASGNNFYTIADRVDIGSSGTSDVTGPIYTTGASTYNTEINILMHVTDAGAETTTFSSRLQLSLDGGATWFYDTASDASLPNGWRLDGGSRIIMWDIAPSGVATYDNFSITSIYAPTVPSRIWTGGGTDDNWSTAANWGGIAPSSGESVVFNGTTRQANVNDLVDFTASSVTFSNGGFSLGGSPWSIGGAITSLGGTNTFASDLSWNSTFAKPWNIANNSEIILSGLNMVEANGDQTIFGGGNLRVTGTMSIGQSTTANPAFIILEGKHIVDGGTYISRGGYRIGSQATGSGAQTILTNNANFSLTVSGAALRVGDSANPVPARLVIDNSTLSMAGGSMGIPYAAGTTSEVSQVGGLFTGGIVNFSQTGVGQGTYTVQNGTVEPLQIKKNTAGGDGRIYFNNAILRPASGALDPFFSGLNAAEIQAGGLTVDGTSDITIAQVLSGAGALTKINYSTVTLTGANTYTGNTVVQGGRLVLPNVQSNATTVQVSGSAELGVLNATAGKSLTVSSISFLGSSSAFNFDLGTLATPTAALVKVTSLSVSSPVTVNVVNGLLLTTGQFPLVDYDGAIAGGFQFTLGSLPSGVVATLSNNVANSSVDLVITGVPGYTWTGAVNGDWDYGTQNWIDQQTQTPSTYADGFPVEFNDSASNGVVNITGLPNPSYITVSNNTLPYVWVNGGIGNPSVPRLVKLGSGSLTRVENASDIIERIELNEGSYIISNASDTVFTSIVTDAGVGTGTLVKQGQSILSMATNNNFYDGAILVQEGTMKLVNTNLPLGKTTGSTTIATGATLDLNDMTAPGEPVFVGGAGVSGQGAIIDSTSGGAVATSLTDVTMTGDTTFGAPNGGRWDIRVRPSTGAGPGLKGNGFNLTKVGPGFVSIASQRSLGTNTPYWEMNLGDVLVSEGTLALAESINLGNPAKNLTINSGATLQLYNLALTNPIVRNVIVTDARILSDGGIGSTNVIGGSINLTGANNFHADQTAFILNAAISGSGSMNISGVVPGGVYLNGANNYSGDTVVTNGLLGGTGSIAGNLIMLGGTNSPGSAAGGIGTFTVNGSATLAGTTFMELDRSQSPNSDRLVVGGTLSFGGQLTVALAAGAASPQAGDVYQLFNKGSGSSFSAINLPDLSALPGGLAWDTSNLAANGTISVTGVPSSPTIGNVGISGGNFVFSGTGGVEGSTYIVLTSTNVALPTINWTPAATNVFGPGGTFSYTNAVNPATPQTFYLLKLP